MVSIWGWDAAKQNWAYYSPDPNDGFYKSYPAITKLETGRAYWIQFTPPFVDFHRPCDPYPAQVYSAGEVAGFR